MLLVPYLTAATVTGKWSVSVWLALLAVLFAFVARYPIELLLVPESYLRVGRPDRSDVVQIAWIYGMAAGWTGVVLVVVWKLIILVPLGVLAVLLFLLRIRWARRGGVRALLAEITGTVALSLSGVVGWVAGGDTLGKSSLLLWFLNCVFFCSGTLYVKSRILSRTPDLAAQGQQMAKLTLAFHLGTLMAVGVFLWLKWAAPLIVVPFLLSSIRALWGLSRPKGKLVLPRLGWIEVALSLVFAVLVVMGITR